MALFTGDFVGALHLHFVGPFILVLVALLATYFAGVVFTKFRGLEWRKEATAYTGVEVLAFVMLLIGWVGKAFIN